VDEKNKLKATVQRIVCAHKDEKIAGLSYQAMSPIGYTAYVVLIYGTKSFCYVTGPIHIVAYWYITDRI